MKTEEHPAEGLHELGVLDAREIRAGTEVPALTGEHDRSRLVLA